VIETNLFGQVHGPRAAVPRFKAQGSGVLINMSSVWGRVTTPDVMAYVTSKFAVRAFSECLRQELRHLPHVDVATMLSQAVDTPIFARGANHAGRAVRPVPPVFEAGSFTAEPAPPTTGAVLHPVPASEGIDGGWRRDRRRELVRALLAATGGLVRGIVRGR
jgi:NAD(P)-dependent dehydrogenase (short-subunit alcohol dehydrogenase family)